MDPEGLEGHRLEFCGVDVWLVTKAISTTVLRQVCKHKIHLKHKGLIVIQIRCVKLNAELADIIELHLLLAIPNEKRPGRECVLILDDVSRDQMVMVSPRWLRFRIFNLARGGTMSVRDCRKPT